MAARLRGRGPTLVHPLPQAMRRALSQSGRFDRTWNMLGETYKREVTLPDNVVALHRP